MIIILLTNEKIRIIVLRYQLCMNCFNSIKIRHQGKRFFFLIWLVGVSYAYTLYVIINNLHSPFIPTLPSFKWQNRRVTLKSTSLLNPTIINHFSNFAFSIRPCAALFNKRNDIIFKVVKNPFKATFYQGVVTMHFVLGCGC